MGHEAWFANLQCKGPVGSANWGHEPEPGDEAAAVAFTLTGTVHFAPGSLSATSRPTHGAGQRPEHVGREMSPEAIASKAC